ncbi:MAG: hypothetical protein FJX72_12580 [Armatimonadetes bacterium]|nr:hypothetical protein [Armatimonadota bacterium]
MVRVTLGVLLATIALASLAVPPDGPVRDRWRFKFNRFLIGAWWGPDATDAEMKSYREAGFNVVMAGRYMQMDSYGNPAHAVRELDLAAKHGMGVMFDTYTKNDRPWGGKADPYEPHPNHHPATLTELKWLYERIGRHRALVGFMIGDDQGSVVARSKACTDFLFERRPHLMPWLCGWIDPTNLSANNNPIANPQIYPTLYEWALPAEDLAQRYCAAYASYSRRCRENGVVFWPMFNVQGSFEKQDRDMDGCIPTDSLLRLPAYAALAYGAEGIWYFCYNAGSLQHLGPHDTDEKARKARTALWPVAQRINRRIASWGPLVMGRTCAGVFGTAFRPKSMWPFPEEAPAYGVAEDLAEPGDGKLIEAMDGDLLVGMLTKPGKRALAMVVDCRAAKTLGTLPEREVTIRFAPCVARVGVIEGGKATLSPGPAVRLKLEAGGGQLVELAGRGIETLARREAIYTKRPPAGTVTVRPLAIEDLRGAVAAVLRVDVFGSNSGPYAEKWVVLNGEKIGRAPTTNRDDWVLTTIELTREQIGLLRAENEIVITNEGGDAWKFRNLCLAVRRADGTWCRSETARTVHSSANWAHSEGEPFLPDGRSKPIPIRLGR